MDAKTIGTVAIGVVIAALLTTVLLMPIIDSSTQHIETVDNENTNRMSEVVGPLELIKQTGEDNSVYYTLNDDVVDSTFTGASNGYIITDKFIIRSANSWSDFFVYGIIGVDEAPTVIAVTIDSATLDNGEWTIVKGTTTYTGTYAFAYCFDKDGDYCWSTSSGGPNVDTKSQIITFRTSSQDYGVGIGTANNMDNVFQVTSGSRVTDYSESVTTVAADDGSMTITAASGNIMVPVGYSIVVENTDSASELLHLIPLLIVVGIIMGTVGLFVLRRE